MKDHLRRIVGAAPTNLLQRCVAREYVQARILQSLQDGGTFLRWVFLGGTALRFLYGLPRYSEDLDFSLAPNAEDIGFRETILGVKRVFDREGYDVRVAVNDRKTVHSAFVRFGGLPFELGLSPRRAETLSVRVEVDTNPPKGARIATTLVRRHVALNLAHYDRSSLLSGKLHALLSRPYLKGRDLFDLVWYLADRDWPPPNFPLLNAALSQTGWDGPELVAQNWRAILHDRLARIDWKNTVEDVRPFLERENDAALLTRLNVLKLLAVS